ncbi:uncharacterized protein BDR25DRAFT_93388 [Lindgomyces ingoldianus]|uniref:Uncharacterized protein n=1 Tax=Lindgomyces ingoldianus TaxID=673940 RepID=A0ACB6QD76_9PLEO|nr:uncharacterized protein BDR25DRAFT_93388 [Lindgomyces ingoldianus]KAF2464846.1 hypothetical protein BDR25DRAFT_93388 [Lindgomyces ingoldianus]
MVESRQPEALALICLFPILATIFVGLRTFSRYLGQNFGWDDWLIHVALLLLLGETITSYQYVILSHTGYHVYDIPKQTVAQQVDTLKWSFAVQLFYHPMMGAIRASIIMFLFRVKDKRWFIQFALHIVFWINIGYMVSTTFVNIFQCNPVHYTYMRPQEDQELNANGKVIKHGKCIDSLSFILASCGLSIFMDLIIIPIPTAMVWKLQMRRKTKIAVVVIMSMGWIATAVSVGRFIVYYYRFSPTNTDRSYNIGIVISIAEPAVGIIAACAPAMKCLFRHLMPRYFSDGGSADPSRTRSQPISRHRKSSSFHDARDEGSDYGRTRGLGREEEVYGMRPLESLDSRDQIVSAIGGPPGRTRSTKTGYSEVEEAIPKNFLNHNE